MEFWLFFFFFFCWWPSPALEDFSFSTARFIQPILRWDEQRWQTDYSSIYNPPPQTHICPVSFSLEYCIVLLKLNSHLWMNKQNKKLGVKHDTKFCIWIRHSSDKVHQDISLQSILTFGNICHKLTLRYLIKGVVLNNGGSEFFFFFFNMQ